MTPELVAERTRKRILTVMKKVGYVPDRNAAALVKQSTGFMGLIVSSITSSTFAPEIEGLAEFGLTTGREILLAHTNYENEREYDVLRNMLGRRPDGLVLTFSPTDASARKLLKNSGVPIVETWNDPAKPIDMVVGFSNDEAARKIARHFHSNGRKKPAVFSQLIGRDIIRWEGFSDEFMKLGGKRPVNIPIGSGTKVSEESFSSGADFFTGAAQLGEGFDCVFCTSDVTAASVLFEAQRRGIIVPDDLAVAGFGDLEFADSLFPRLTTIKVPAYEMGRKSGELILARLTGQAGRRKVILDTDLIVRDSS